MVMMVMYDLFHCAAKIGLHVEPPKMILKMMVASFIEIF